MSRPAAAGERGRERGPGPGRPRLVSALAALITVWAAAAGVLLLALAGATALSATGNLVFAAPWPPEHEVTKLVVGVAVFMLLPYCQLSGANVTVDIFTSRMGPRVKAVMAALASLLALGFALLLLRQMSAGLESYREFVEVTPVLQIPIWTAFPPILASLALLGLAAVLTLADSVRAVAGRPSWFAAEAG